MSSLGAIIAVPVAFALKSTVFKGETPPFVMELPPYKWPSPGIVLTRVYASAKSFVTRAGTLILATSLLVWALGYFPVDHAPLEALNVRIEALAEELEEPLSLRAELEEREAAMAHRSEDELSAADRAELEARRAAVASQLEELGREDLKAYDDLVSEKNRMSAELLERSFLGRLGHAIEPAVRPLGWDWKIGVGVLASFPAREVIVSTLGTIYSLGGEVDESSGGLSDALRASKWPDGRPVFTIPVALSIMVFFRPVRAVRVDPDGDPARNELVGLGGVHVRLHDGAGLRGRVRDVPGGGLVAVKCPLAPTPVRDFIQAAAPWPPGRRYVGGWRSGRRGGCFGGRLRAFDHRLQRLRHVFRRRLPVHRPFDGQFRRRLVVQEYFGVVLRLEVNKHSHDDRPILGACLGNHPLRDRLRHRLGDSRAARVRRTAVPARRC